MSHSMAAKLTKETGYDIKWNSKQQVYLFYPLEIPCRKPKEVVELSKNAHYYIIEKEN